MEAVGLLNKLEPYYTVGGIATQSYLPTSCRRLTSDVDFSVVRSLTRYEDFKFMIKPVTEYLRDKGYSTETKKRSRSYSLNITDPNGESLALEFARRNKQNFEKNKNRLERELDNANLKIIEERDSSFRVARAEDIAIPKLVRSVGSLKRNRFFLKYTAPYLTSLSLNQIGNLLRNIAEKREEAMINPADSVLAEDLRFNSDLYDIRILSEIVGFNEGYLAQVKSEWDVLNNSRSEADLLSKILLPIPN